MLRDWIYFFTLVATSILPVHTRLHPGVRVKEKLCLKCKIIEDLDKVVNNLLARTSTTLFFVLYFYAILLPSTCTTLLSFHFYTFPPIHMHNPCCFMSISLFHGHANLSPFHFYVILSSTCTTLLSFHFYTFSPIHMHNPCCFMSRSFFHGHANLFRFISMSLFHPHV